MIGSTHNHSTGSDGKLTPEEIIKKAISLNWDYVYFTDHYFAYPKYRSKEKYEYYFNKNYVEEVKKLKEKYKNKIPVLFGVELDWLENDSNHLKKQAKKHNFNYIIGSIHGFEHNGVYRGIEETKDYWLESAKLFGGTKKYVQEYYNQIKGLIKSGVYDSVGHFDHIKLFNKKQSLFSEKEDWYKKEVSEVLDLIKKQGMALELNHGGIRKCGKPFPSTWILKEANKRKIPLTLGLDAHYPEHYSNQFMNELILLAKKAGYNEVVRFEKRKMIRESI